MRWGYGGREEWSLFETVQVYSLFRCIDLFDGGEVEDRRSGFKYGCDEIVFSRQ